MLDVPGDVAVLGEGVEAPASGVAIGESVGAAVFVDGHQVGELVAQPGREFEDIYVAGQEKPVDRLVTSTQLVVELELPPRWMADLTAERLSMAVRAVRLERAGIPVDGPVVPFEELPNEDRRAWLDTAEAVRRLATSDFASSSEGPKEEVRRKPLDTGQASNY